MGLWAEAVVRVPEPKQVNILKELYGDSVEHRVFDELMKDKWVA